jgi:AmmeMemoRadiSam system protein B
MNRVRQPAVAGLFYPGDPDELRQVVRRYLQVPQNTGAPPKALIVPHAGYAYSGPVAATAYARLRPLAGRIQRVVLLGPAHRVPLGGLALPESDEFATPLGRVKVDAQAAEKLVRLPQVQTWEGAHALEHSLEVHLPFLQELLGHFAIVPLVVGDARPEEVAQVLEALWGGEETLILVSSDMSHYHDYQTARRLDGHTARTIENLDIAQLRPEQACGCLGIQGLLLAAQRRNMAVRCVDLRNSGDTAGPRDRVVGYGAYVVS